HFYLARSRHYYLALTLLLRIMYIMLNYVNRLLDPCSFALRSRFHAWFEAFSRVPHLDGLLPRLNPGQIWQHPHKTSATSFARSRWQQCGIARHGPDMSKCPSAR
ncbi:hypothetical protein FA096_26600, partial [Pseudomonas aeruginosa]|nr:hypothetical protein [Pseudomonas aeruginosa]